MINFILRNKHSYAFSVLSLVFPIFAPMALIHTYWAHLGGAIALAILLTAALNTEQWTGLELLLWLHVALLLLHQCEEYVYPGGFQEFYNTNVWGKSPLTSQPLTGNGVLFVNVVLGWTAYTVAALVGAKVLWFAVGLFFVTLLNGVMHTVMAVLLRQYNPGFFTGLFAFLPFGVFALGYVRESLVFHEWLLAGGVGLLSAAAIPTAIRITSALGKHKAQSK